MYINNLWMKKGKSPDDMLYLMYGILFIAPSNAMSSDAWCHVLHQVLQFSGGVMGERQSQNRTHIHIHQTQNFLLLIFILVR